MSRSIGRRSTCLTVSMLCAGLTFAGDTVVGRVRIRPSDDPQEAVVQQVRSAVQARLTTNLEAGVLRRRLLALRPLSMQPPQFVATVYDYTLETGLELIVDGDGKELSRRELGELLPASPGEIHEAEQQLSLHSIWSSDLQSGAVRAYPAMPSTSRDPSGRRLINLGLTDRRAGTDELSMHEVVSVHLPTGSITRYAGGAPPTSQATAATCGPPAQPCTAATAPCGLPVHVDWPSDDPVWSFDVLHPACTVSVQPDATGIELRNVFYRGKLVLIRAHMPVLNVQYQNNACGPYRDWLYDEDCFTANGVDVAPGFRVTTGGAPPTTQCTQHTDNGNFKGVAIHDEGPTLWLITEASAGWYRYESQWRLGLDGSIQPRMGFGATENSCVCNIHFHHAYWRFEWAPDGAVNDSGSGIAAIERRVGTSGESYSAIGSEGKFLRPQATVTADWWRVRNATTGTAYVIKPSSVDGSASGDAYAKGDVWALAANPNEINDPDNFDTTIAIDAWVNAEPLGTTKRAVTWYRAGFVHNINGGVGPDHAEDCHVSGPLIELATCKGQLRLNRSVYRCDEATLLSLTDGDRAGNGTLQIALSSTSETSPETVTLTEDSTKPGSFSGSIVLTSAAPQPGDAKLTARDGDTIRARYTDASACGVANLPIEETAAVDCRRPGPEFVRAENVTPTSATIAWQLAEPGTATVHYGLSAPGNLSATVSSRSTQPRVAISGLTECTEYLLWVESSDKAGNVGTNDNYGRYFRFTTAKVGGGWCGAHARVTSVTPQGDACSSGGAGNGNGIVDPGEQSTLVAALNNDGANALTGVSVSLAPMVRDVAMLDDNAAVPNVGVSGNANSSAPHLIGKFPATLPCGTRVDFLATIRSDQGVWTNVVPLTLGTLTPNISTPLNENFAGGIPGTWQVVNGGMGGGAAGTWTTANPGNRSIAAPMASPTPIVDGAKAGPAAFMDEQLLSPTLDLSTAKKVTLELDHYFNAVATSPDTARIEVRTTFTDPIWSTVYQRQASSSPNPEHLTLDLTPYAAGAASVRLRFYYATGSRGNWWQIDNVKLTAEATPNCATTVCVTTAAGAPRPIPDGTFGSAMRATKQADGSVNLQWDATSCPSPGAHIVFGRLANVAAQQPEGGVCWLGSSGQYRWRELPAFDTWFLLVGDNNEGMESSWGSTSTGASGVCWNDERSDASSCP